jgi:hypothetical protein
MTVMNVAKFERFFRLAAGLDVDKNDLKRYSDFVTRKIQDLLIVGEARAHENGRDIIQPADLPITKGLQETIHQFRKLDEEIELGPILVQLAEMRPQLDTAVSDVTKGELPEVLGGLSLALAKTFTILDGKVKNPSSDHWERSFQTFDLLL